MTEQTAGKRFELRPTICTNDETNLDHFRDLVDPEMDSHEESLAVDQIVRAIIEAAREACGDYETDQHFKNWHGGRYSSQCSMYGYSHITGGVVEVVEIITFLDEEGDEDGEESRRVPIAEYTAEHKAAIEALNNAIDAAVATEVESINALDDEDA